MIGVFDSGLGGLTVLRALVERFPGAAFVYLGDHANMPIGDRASDDIVVLTRTGADALFRHGHCFASAFSKLSGVPSASKSR